MADRLIGDIGGTHSRLALAGAGIRKVKVYDNAGFTGLDAIIEDYLQRLAAAERPASAALAVACPVGGDKVRLTNLGWGFSIEDYRRRFGFDTLHVLNDFAAAAMAIPALGPGDVVTIGGGEALPGRPVGVIGPGTGLGVAALVPWGETWIPVAGEGGHVTLPPATDEEDRIIAALRRRRGHVSAERLLSGPGLALLYQVLAGTEGEVPAPEAITRLALSNEDPLAARALDHFLAMLGTVAGNLALTLGAQGGVYLAGGILPDIAGRLQDSLFRERFVDKGRYREYLEAIPTQLITRDNPALLGLKRYLQERQGA
ncbi:MAG: glucokinase [Gammaproteobacteria bacterium]|jgi:glucokinase